MESPRKPNRHRSPLRDVGPVGRVRKVRHPNSHPNPRRLPQAKSLPKARTLIYDATQIFCDRFIDKFSRTRDQMIQAARSGRQNIAGGRMASATSKKSELKLTNVAKASLEELHLDYEDYLRQTKLSLWHKNDPRTQEIRPLGQVRPPRPNPLPSLTSLTIPTPSPQ